MQYLLEPIHHYVYQHLQPAMLLQPGIVENTLLFNAIDEALDALPANIIRQVCSANSNKEKRVLIQSTQSSAIIISNQLHKYVQTVSNWQLCNESKEEYLALYNATRDRLMASLDVLQQFDQYLDKEQALPDHLYEKMKQWVHSQILLFTDEWKGRISKALVDIILLATDEFIEAGAGQNPCYRQLQYLQALFKKLKKLSQACPANAEEAMLYTLINLNFNHENFIVYAVNKLIPPFSEDGKTGELLQYRRVLQLLKRLHPVPCLALYPHQPTCLQSITECLQEEVSLLQNEDMKNNQLIITSDDNKHSVLQFNTCLNISQLGLFLSLLKKTGILTVKPMDKFFMLVAAKVNTPRASNYSPRSLETAYQRPEQSAKNMLKDQLFNLFNELKRL